MCIENWLLGHQYTVPPFPIPSKPRQLQYNKPYHTTAGCVGILPLQLKPRKAPSLYGSLACAARPKPVGGSQLHVLSALAADRGGRLANLSLPLFLWKGTSPQWLHAVPAVPQLVTTQSTGQAIAPGSMKESALCYLKCPRWKDEAMASEHSIGVGLERLLLLQSGDSWR